MNLMDCETRGTTALALCLGESEDVALDLFLDENLGNFQISKNKFDSILVF